MRTSKASVIALSTLSIAGLSIAGCASRGALPGQFPLFSDARHAHVNLLDELGRERVPFEGQVLFMVPDHSFSSDGIGVVPGMRRLWLHCPPGEDGVAVNDLIPAIDFDFEAGKHYDLRCVDGLPRITERSISATSP